MTVKDFYNIFTTPFENVAHDMNADKIVQVKDWLGSSVFMKLFQKQVTSTSHHEFKTKNTTPTYTPCSECYDSTLKNKNAYSFRKHTIN